MVLEILCVEPIYPQYSGVLETCLALRYWFFEVLGSESVNTVLSVSCSLVICWEMTDLLALLCVRFSSVNFLLSHIHVVSLNRCGTRLYRFLIFALFTLSLLSRVMVSAHLTERNI